MLLICITILTVTKVESLASGAGTNDQDECGLKQVSQQVACPGGLTKAAHQHRFTSGVLRGRPGAEDHGAQAGVGAQLEAKGCGVALVCILRQTQGKRWKLTRTSQKQPSLPGSVAGTGKGCVVPDCTAEPGLSPRLPLARLALETISIWGPLALAAVFSAFGPLAQKSARRSFILTLTMFPLASGQRVDVVQNCGLGIPFMLKKIY